MQKIALLLILCISYYLNSAQIVESFTDGDFTSNPTWQGDIDLFIVNDSLQLQSQGPEATESIHLATASTRVSDTEWRIRARYENAPSNNNSIRIYLVADTADLEAPLNGYFIQLGENGSDDGVELFRQDGQEEVSLWEPVAGTISDGIDIHLRIVRDGLGNWTVFYAPYNSEEFLLENTVFDDTYTTTEFMGIVVNHTSTRRNDFLFDDIYVGEPIADTIAPEILSLQVVDPNTLNISFSEPLDTTTATNINNYTANEGLGNPQGAQINPSDPTLIQLVFANTFLPNTPYQLSVAGITDLSGNPLDPIELPFTFFQVDTAAANDVIINELMADPTPEVGLPNAEYLELFNRSEKTINLLGWTVSNGTSIGILPELILAPGEYVLIVDSDDQALFDTLNNVVSPNIFPSLVNGGDNIGLRNEAGVLIDTVDYNITWYRNPDRDGGGYSLERINPNPISCPPTVNWIASEDPSGGTPGFINSVFTTEIESEPPILESVSVLGRDTLLICFNKSMDPFTLENIANYELTAGLNPVSATSIAPDFRCVKLALSDTLLRGTLYTLTISNVADCSVNVIPQALLSEIFLGFEPDEGNVIVNEIMADPVPAVGLPEAEYVEIFNRSDQTFNLQGWTISNGSQTGLLPDYVLEPGAYVLIIDEADRNLYNDLPNVISPSVWPGLVNGGDEIGLRSQGGVLVDTVTYTVDWYGDGTKALGGFSLERIDPNPISCPDISNWTASLNENGGTPGLENSVLESALDETPPLIQSISVIAEDTLELCFNESMELSTIGEPSNFQISTDLTIEEVVPIFPDLSCVRLVLSGNLVPGTIYEIVVSNVQDCKGNGITEPLSIEVLQGLPPEQGDIVINEIMADPTPPQGLPEAEYIELYNRSENTYNLGGWSLSNGSTEGSLPDFILAPDSYVILTRSTDTALFTGFGAVLGLSSWPSLTNSADNIGLRSLNDILLDTVNYQLSWYRDDEKDNGGFALERINPVASDCPESANWRASEDESGGTPGRINSVFSDETDQTAPEVLSVLVLTPDTLLLCFNEQMDPASLEAIPSFSLSPSISIGTSLPLAPDYFCVKLGLADSLDENTTYLLTISDVADCSGNVIEQDIEIEVTPGEIATAGDIIINEIMADPSPSAGLPEAEYLELYNRSDKSINLQGWTISNGSTEGELPAFVISPDEYVIITQRSDSGSFVGLGNILVPGSWPSLVNTQDDLGLRTNTGVLVDTLSYSINWYRDSEKDNGGYSLERINPNTIDCPPVTNWIASNDPRGGSPGIQNSVFSTAIETNPPFLESVTIEAPDTLLLCFDESMNPAEMVNLGKYQMNNGINIGSAIAQGPDFVCVRLVLSQSLQPDITYTLTVRDAVDCAGNVNENPQSIAVVLGREPVTFDVIINEMMPDPSPVVGLPESEYIELFNRSEKNFNLDGWTVTNGSTTGTLPSYVLSPGAYVILVPEDELPLFDGFDRVVSPSSWPSLVNRGDNLGLRSPSGVLLDTLEYVEDWYRDPDKDNGGYSLERINPEEFDCPSAANWIASDSPEGGTPGAINSVFSDLPDTTPPAVIEVQVVSPDTLLLCFNETMDPASLEALENYQLGVAAIEEAIAQAPNFDCVQLILQNPLKRGASYELNIDNLTDCKGNRLEGPVIIPVILGEPAEPFDVVINEIFPDPSPRVDLPEVEFIEIFNRTKKILDISNWGIQDPSTTGTWGSLNLLPSELVILCSEEDAPLFEEFGRVVVVDRFPSLGNTTDSLFLINELGFTMDYVFYSNDWYGNEVKRDGGWTLERRDPTYVDCNNGGNWGASRNERGGTPGEENSIQGIFNDTIPPRVTGVVIEDPVTIAIFFNEQMDFTTLQNGDNFEVDLGIGQPLLGFPVAPTYQQVLLLLNEELDSTSIYTLTFAGLQDCGGNEISGTLQFGIPGIIEQGDIKLNEILFNPFKGGSDFVEIVNVSDKVLDLQELLLGEIDPLTGEIVNAKVVAEQTVLVLPGEIVCLTSDVAIQQTFYNPPDTANFYQMESFPSYDDAEGIAVVFTTRDTLDVFAYLDDFHFPTLADDEGVSLERISLERPASEPTNWHSASSTVGYATPGYENSQLTDVDEPPSEVSLAEDTFSPNADGDRDVLPINYDFDFIGANTRISIYDINGRLIRILQRNTLLDPGPGTIFWDGRNDQNQKADIGPYVILFEVTDQQTGEKKVFKLVAILADQF